MLTFAAWLHDLDPFAIEFGDVPILPDGIRWYGLSYLLGFFLGWLLVRRVTRVGISSLRPEQVSDYIVTVAIGIVLGGRLGYCLFYRPELFVTFYSHPPFWGVVALNEGGMASHGGILGGVLACWWFSRRGPNASGGRGGHDLPHLLDLFAFGAPLGLFFGRLANFVNGELFGREAPADAWYAVKFPQEMGDWSAEQLDVVRRALAAVPEARPHLDHYGAMIDYAIVRIQQGDPAVRAAVEPLLTPRHPSQLYAAVAEGLVVMAVLLWVWRKPRLPGIVGSWFAISYAVMRIIDEFFRRPDAHLMEEEFAALGITRGQWLSVILLAVGLWGLWFSHHRARKWGIPKMGSWIDARGASARTHEGVTKAE